MDAMTHCYLDWHEPRDHPYLGNGEHQPNTGYYDFKATPELIPLVLEDFIDTPPASAFYELVRWLNGPGLLLESNDCAFSPAHLNVSEEYPQPLEASGRLMILYRDLILNVLPDMRTLLNALIEDALKEADPTLRWGAVRISHCPIRFRHLVLANGQFAEGVQLSLHFWAWGETEHEVYANLIRVFKAIRTCLDKTNSFIQTTISNNDELLTLQADQKELFRQLFSITTANQDRYKPRQAVLSHLRRLTETRLLCGRSMFNQALIGTGNAPSISADKLRLCKICQRRFQHDLQLFVDSIGVPLSDWTAFVNHRTQPKDDTLTTTISPRNKPGHFEQAITSRQ